MNTPAAMPAHVAHARRSICKRCDQPCEAQQARKLNHADPCAACPRQWTGRWGKWGKCESLTPPPARAVGPALAEPSVIELGVNFTVATAEWLAAGAPVVSPEVYAARAVICDGCEYWDGAARLGLGKCGAPGCGCTKFKRWYATQQCPIGKWPVAPR